MQSVEHVSELFFLLRGQSRDERLELARLEVRHLEEVTQKNVAVKEARPGKQMNQTEMREVRL